MTSLDGDAIRAGVGELAASRLAGFEAFAEIDSTNSYLMHSEAPAIGAIRVALTDNQTAGRGRHGRTWQSPAGSGLCLSVAYTFGRQPRDLAALTLALGLGVAETLDGLGAEGVQLKWPNDLMADDSKLGGILTEAQAPSRGAITVVTGIGINLDLREGRLDSGLGRKVIDLERFAGEPLERNKLAARLIDGICETFVTYETSGFEAFAARWPRRDWLLGRGLTISLAQEQLTGVGAGVAEDGALLVDTGSGAFSRVTSGTIVSTAFARAAP
jgi:BirA family biotin operon repressor/biotin-[acetyl-CoA-carboxylase] ligase